MLAAVPRRRRNKAILPAAETVTAASAIYGGKGGKGGKGTGRGKGPGDHRPLCLNGSQCKNFGTWTGCSAQHTDADRTEMQRALGDNFVSREMRMRINALHAANQPTAVDASTGNSMQPPVPPIAPQPLVPQPQLSAAEARAKQAVDHLKALKKAQLAHPPQDGSVPSGVACTSCHISPCVPSAAETRQRSRLAVSMPSSCQGMRPGNPPSSTTSTSPCLSPRVHLLPPHLVTRRQAPKLSVQQRCRRAYPCPKRMSSLLCYASSRLSFLVATCALVIFQPARQCCHRATGAILELPRATAATHVLVSPLLHQKPAIVMLQPTISIAGQTTVYGAPAEPTCKYQRLEQANRASASHDSGRMQPHCLRCPYSLPQYTADGSRSGRYNIFKCPCGRK
jgi:hypothetical protein